jgi:hypothetical protein
MRVNIDEARTMLRAAFSASTEALHTSLRASNALDDYEQPPEFDPGLDRPTDQYLEKYYHGIFFLDPESFVYYLPIVLEYGLANPESTSMAVDTLLFAMRLGAPEGASCPPLPEVQAGAVVAALCALRVATGEELADEVTLTLQGAWRSPAPADSR